MTPEQKQEVINFVIASKESRRMSYLQLSISLFDQAFGQTVIRRCLERHGFRRRIARRKPPISEKNRVDRLAWAHEHVDWSDEQWGKILWTDETWVVGGPHRKAYITRRQGEEWDPTCIVEKYRKKGGWMFWGSFSGASGKGPGVFWEKEWGSINEESYQEHTVPIIHEWLLINKDSNVDLDLMQDNAAGHASKSTRKCLEILGIPVIFWPAFSPDLNPIEMCWNWMKDYIEDKWGLEEKPLYRKLRGYVKEAWEALPEEYMRELLASMRARCLAVIEANGMHTMY
jgi:hypothetical protein